MKLDKEGYTMKRQGTIYMHIFNMLKEILEQNNKKISNDKLDELTIDYIIACAEFDAEILLEDFLRIEGLIK